MRWSVEVRVYMSCTRSGYGWTLMCVSGPAPEKATAASNNQDRSNTFLDVWISMYVLGQIG